MPKIKRQFSYLLLFLAFFLGFFVSAPTLVGAEGTVGNLDNTNSFYGNQSLNSMEEGDKIMISLPSGTRMEIENNQVTYAMNDHVNSARVAMSGGNTVSGQVDYTPFGELVGETSESEVNVTRSYTGQVFEPETATYDYHARRYDTSINRFLSVDALRQTPSPYVYVSNNPINRIDPSGNFNRLFDALDLAVTPRQSLELRFNNIDYIKNVDVSTLKTRPQSVFGFSNDVVTKPGEIAPSSGHGSVSTNRDSLSSYTSDSGSYTSSESSLSGLSESTYTGDILSTPLARRLMTIHTDPKNSARVNSVRSTLTKAVGPGIGEDSKIYGYYSKPKDETLNKFKVLYTPHSIEFINTRRDPRSLHYATDVVRDQYLDYIKRVDGRNKDIRYIKRLDVVNEDVKAFLRNHYGRAPKDVLLEGFLRVKGNGRSTKRILDEFNLRATGIYVDGPMSMPNITIYVEPKM